MAVREVRAARRSRHARHGDGKRRVGTACERTSGHGLSHVLAHDAFLLDHLRIDVEKRCLGFGRIGHEALAEPCGAAGHLGDGGGDAAARAAFGRHDDVPPLCGDDAETLGRQRYALVEIRHDPQPKSQPRMLTTTQA